MVRLTLQIKDGVMILNKGIIIAICGKSASGKTTLAENLFVYFSKLGIKTHQIVSFTTRKRRWNEREGIDYCFVSDKIFKTLEEKKQLIESTCFNGWHYGTAKFSLLDNTINIGVFNPDGMKSLAKLQDKYIVIPVFLTAATPVRLFRSIKREKELTFEMLRRMVVDFKDFHNFPATLEFLFKQKPLILKSTLPQYLVFEKVNKYFKLCIEKK
jgi:guanylate kinase